MPATDFFPFISHEHGQELRRICDILDRTPETAALAHDDLVAHYPDNSTGRHARRLVRATDDLRIARDLGLLTLTDEILGRSRDCAEEIVLGIARFT
jgi:hypothetical protein